MSDRRTSQGGRENSCGRSNSVGGATSSTTLCQRVTGCCLAHGPPPAMHVQPGPMVGGATSSFLSLPLYPFKRCAPPPHVTIFSTGLFSTICCSPGLVLVCLRRASHLFSAWCSIPQIWMGEFVMATTKSKSDKWKKLASNDEERYVPPSVGG